MKKKNNKVTNDRNISFYYINTNEIQGELSRENMIFTCENNMLSSRVKRSPFLWLHNKSRLSQEKKCLTEMVLYFMGVYIINRTLHSRLEIRNFFPRVEDISLVCCPHLWNIFSTLEEKFRSYLIGLMGTYSKTSNVLMRIIFVFSLPPRSFKEALRPRNSSTLNTKTSKWQKKYYKI